MVLSILAADTSILLVSVLLPLGIAMIIILNESASVMSCLFVFMLMSVRPSLVETRLWDL